MILTDEEALQIVKGNALKAPAWIDVAREDSKKLFALIEGKNFIETLINRIEFIESADKANARKKWSRNIVDLYERLSKPISNVFTATGGSKKYEIENKKTRAKFFETIGNIRDGKSIQKYVQDEWVPVYMSDPNGLIFMEYRTGDNPKVWPTYKSIERIRNYRRKGQLTEWVLFEAKLVDKEKSKKVWRIVDDLTDRFYLQNGEIFTLLTEENTADTNHLPASFEHPFGEVPAIINSNIVDVQTKIHLSFYNKITELCEEYARDQSIKSLLKKFHGFPIFWRLITQCKECTGTGKTGQTTDHTHSGVSGREPQGKCGSCDGKGFYHSKDVTDSVQIPVPKEGQPSIAPDIAGYIAPPLETWTKHDEELALLEDNAEDTIWGTHKEKGSQETATARYIDTQPVMNTLTDFSHVAQFRELKLSEWVLKFISPNEDVKGKIMIIYGTRFILEPVDSILEKYTKAKLAGENTVILDRMFNEYLTAKYGNDPQWLREELIKAELEPYLHLPLERVNSIFGRKEAQREVFFKQWWELNRELAITQLDIEKVRVKFKEDFDKQFITETVVPDPAVILTQNTE